MEILWTIIAVVVPLLIGLGVALVVPDASSNQLQFARFCFLAAALLLSGQTIYWFLKADVPFAQRCIIGFCVGAVVFIGFPESIRWVNAREKRTAPTESTISASSAERIGAAPKIIPTTEPYIVSINADPESINEPIHDKFLTKFLIKIANSKDKPEITLENQNDLKIVSQSPVLALGQFSNQGSPDHPIPYGETWFIDYITSEKINPPDFHFAVTLNRNILQYSSSSGGLVINDITRAVYPHMQLDFRISNPSSRAISVSRVFIKILQIETGDSPIGGQGISDKATIGLNENLHEGDVLQAALALDLKPEENDRFTVTFYWDGKPQSVGYYYTVATALQTSQGYVQGPLKRLHMQQKIWPKYSPGTNPPTHFPIIRAWDIPEGTKAPVINWKEETKHAKPPL